MLCRANLNLFVFCNKMSSPVCIDDFEILARKKLAKSVYDYYSSGANNELSLKDNCRAFQRYRFRPRVLRDVSKIDTTTRVLGTQLDIPVCVAATAMNRMAHPDGEVAVAKAASKMKTGFTLSSWATSSIEEIQDAEPDSLKWMQLYIYKDRELSKQIVTRAERSGFKALLLTVDTPVLGKRYNDVRNNFALPPHLRLKNIILDKDEHAGSVQDAEGGSGLAAHVKELVDPCLTWADITWLRNLTKLPIVLKGIVTREMAKEAVDHGVDGIVVSNHGARQLDGVPATIDALREVVTAVGGRCEVYLDGGVRTGNDVFKAMAFGAKAVFVGRPILWGLAYEGEEGVRKVLQMFKDEFVNTMQLMGCRNMDEVWNDDSLVVPESYFKPKL